MAVLGEMVSTDGHAWCDGTDTWAKGEGLRPVRKVTNGTTHLQDPKLLRRAA